jgi:hypothetical protein
MLSNRLRRSLPVLFLLAGLVLPLTRASAFSPPYAVTHHSSRSLSSAAWAWLAHLFHATWEKNGMTIDPDGKPATTAPPMPQGPNGFMPDPRG